MRLNGTPMKIDELCEILQLIDKDYPLPNGESRDVYVMRIDGNETTLNDLLDVHLNLEDGYAVILI